MGRSGTSTGRVVPPTPSTPATRSRMTANLNTLSKAIQPKSSKNCNNSKGSVSLQLLEEEPEEPEDDVDSASQLLQIPNVQVQSRSKPSASDARPGILDKRTKAPAPTIKSARTRAANAPITVAPMTAPLGPSDTAAPKAKPNSARPKSKPTAPSANSSQHAAAAAPKSARFKATTSSTGSTQPIDTAGSGLSKSAKAVPATPSARSAQPVAAAASKASRPANSKATISPVSSARPPRAIPSKAPSKSTNPKPAAPPTSSAQSTGAPTSKPTKAGRATSSANLVQAVKATAPKLMSKSVNTKPKPKEAAFDRMILGDDGKDNSSDDDEIVDEEAYANNTMPGDEDEDNEDEDNDNECDENNGDEESEQEGDDPNDETFYDKEGPTDIFPENPQSDSSSDLDPIDCRERNDFERCSSAPPMTPLPSRYNAATSHPKTPMPSKKSNGKRARSPPPPSPADVLEAHIKKRPRKEPSVTMLDKVASHQSSVAPPVAKVHQRTRGKGPDLMNLKNHTPNSRIILKGARFDYRDKLLSIHPFPEDTTSRQWVSTAFKHATKVHKVAYEDASQREVDDNVTGMLEKVDSMVRGWVIQAARSICYNAYKLEPPSHLTKEEERTRHIKDEIAKLIGNKWTFVNGDLDGRKNTAFCHLSIQEVIYSGLFYPSKNIDALRESIPKETLCLSVVAIYAALKEWESGRRVLIDFSAKIYNRTYEDVMQKWQQVVELCPERANCILTRVWQHCAEKSGTSIKREERAALGKNELFSVCTDESGSESGGE